MITPEALRRWPLPQPSEAGDKEERGRVLVVGGSAEMPGAVILAATAALRAGAGKLQIATTRSIAQAVAVAVPEGRVFGLPETDTGALDPSAAEAIAKRANAAQAVVIGPGLVDEETVSELLARLLPLLEGPLVILDAAALACLKKQPRCLQALSAGAVLTPHAGEMASIRNTPKEEIVADPAGVARGAAAEMGAVTALKGAETFIAAPDGRLYCNRAGNVGLATSGSGDTLAGIVAGLAARGAEPLQAAVWGVYLHAAAGDRLAARVGPLGFLARELLAEIPALMAELAKAEKGKGLGFRV